MGSLKSPCTTSYRSSIDTIALNCLVYEKIAFFLHFGDRQTDKQTNKQMDSTDALSRSRCRERRLNNNQHYCNFVGGRNSPFPFWPVAYTTACTVGTSRDRPMAFVRSSLRINE